MSIFHLQKSFEKSLRSSSGTYQVPIITPLKTEIHKGCTGKAHACGSVRSTNGILANKAPTTPKPKVKSEGKTLRKNSLSSETVSDSGSEVSSWNSNSNKDSSTASSVPPPIALPKPLKRTQSVTSSAPTNGAAVRRRTSESVISSVDVPDNAKVNGINKRGRLVSETKTEDGVVVSPLRRSSSFRSKNVPPTIPPKPKIVPSSPTPIRRNSSFNNRLRSSFRTKSQAANWNTLWESSFAAKNGGGLLRALDKKLMETSEKVKKQTNRQNITLNVHQIT